ncbi:hypothetical protein [Acidiluteibacter ferrifornacis]|uniref:Uncharacterized protein n=1 Tax=Acidiluteibacter ferrifornacis TaxID=2692424 RepID=A0A6N9NH90_9FLAO|nr:hypothetical protein [Acidiluteibacter ferrifornacis]NBG66038.1 hypothetical protein [Acidiluteibacter ferrifornacis]
MKKIAQIMLISVLVSCSNNYENVLLEEITNKSISLALESAMDHRNEIEYSFNENPEKTGPFYKLSVANFESSMHFLDRIDSFEISQYKDTLKQLLTDYKNLRDTLIQTIKYAGCNSDSLWNFEIDGVSNDNSYLMKLNIAFLNQLSQRCLSSGIDGCNMKFLTHKIFTNQSNNDTFKIQLNSPGIQLQDKRFIKIDSVKLNGVIIESPFTIQPNYAFSNLVSNKLTKGKYEVFGKVNFFPLEEIKLTREFTHSFEQE